MDVASIARSGMAAASAQLSVAASNIANRESRATPGDHGASVSPAGSAGRAGEPSVPLRAVQTSLSNGTKGAGTQVTVAPDEGAITTQYDPGSPYADRNGFAAVPDVNVLQETVDRIMATFAFDANFAMLQTGDEMTRHFLNAASSRAGTGFDP